VDDDVVGRLHLLKVGTRRPRCLPALRRLALPLFGLRRRAVITAFSVRVSEEGGLEEFPEFRLSLRSNCDPGPERFENFHSGFLLRTSARFSARTWPMSP